MCRSAGPDLLPGPRPGSRRFRHIMSSQIFVTFRRRLAALCRKTPFTRTTGQVRCSPAVRKILIIAETGGSVFAVEGSATLSRALRALRVCLYACGGLAAALVFAVLLAGRASAGQNPASAQNPGSAQTPGSATAASTSGLTAGLPRQCRIRGRFGGWRRPESPPRAGQHARTGQRQPGAVLCGPAPSTAAAPAGPSLPLRRPRRQPALPGPPRGSRGLSQAPAASAASSPAAPAASVPAPAGTSGAVNQVPAPAASARPRAPRPQRPGGRASAGSPKTSCRAGPAAPARCPAADAAAASSRRQPPVRLAAARGSLRPAVRWPASATRSRASPQGRGPAAPGQSAGSRPQGQPARHRLCPPWLPPRPPAWCRRSRAASPGRSRAP